MTFLVCGGRMIFVSLSHLFSLALSLSRSTSSLNCLALMLDMACVSLFSPGVLLYIYPDVVDLYDGHPSSGKCCFDEHGTILSGCISTNVLFAFYNVCTFLGDTVSRKLAYRSPPVTPLWFLLPGAVGVVICCWMVPIIAPIGGFLVFFMNGSIYAHTCRYIDTHVSNDFNLVALSFWLFVGDAGSVTGSNLVQTFKCLLIDCNQTYHPCGNMTF